MKLSRKKTVWLVIICIFAVLVFVSAMYLRPLQPAAETLRALESDSRVTVSTDPWLSFSPAEGTPKAGFIFYPGARVLPESYAVLLRGIAAEGFLAVVPKMPLNMAVLNTDVAGKIISEYPGIDIWAIGGHSLGGVMAARYILKNPDVFDGLAFWASYPTETDNLSDRRIAVTSVYGSLDGLASPEEVLGSAYLLPPDTVWVELTGGNHSHFGSYGEQEGDLPATLLTSEQQRQVVEATVSLLEGL